MADDGVTGSGRPGGTARFQPPRARTACGPRHRSAPVRRCAASTPGHAIGLELVAAPVFESGPDGGEKRPASGPAAISPGFARADSASACCRAPVASSGRRRTIWRSASFAMVSLSHGNATARLSGGWCACWRFCHQGRAKNLRGRRWPHTPSFAQAAGNLAAEAISRQILLEMSLKEGRAGFIHPGPQHWVR